MRVRTESYVPYHVPYELKPPREDAPLFGAAMNVRKRSRIYSRQIAIPFSRLTIIRVHEKATEAGWQDQEIRKAILFWTDQMMLDEVAGSDGEVIDYLDEF
jgi:hypothetical protein